jgi:predicted DNA-binding transcriptional regulator AlpA
MAKHLVRPAAVMQRLGVRKSKFWDDIVQREGAGPTIPGTADVPRLRSAHIGPRACVFFEDEIELLIERLRSARDAGPGEPVAPFKSVSRPTAKRRRGARLEAEAD